MSFFIETFKVMVGVLALLCQAFAIIALIAILLFIPNWMFGTRIMAEDFGIVGADYAGANFWIYLGGAVITLVISFIWMRIMYGVTFLAEFSSPARFVFYIGMVLIVFMPIIYREALYDDVERPWVGKFLGDEVMSKITILDPDLEQEKADAAVREAHRNAPKVDMIGNPIE